MKAPKKPPMKIVRVTATPLNVPLHIKLVGVDRQSSLSSHSSISVAMKPSRTSTAMRLSDAPSHGPRTQIKQIKVNI